MNDIYIAPEETERPDYWEKDQCSGNCKKCDDAVSDEKIDRICAD